MSVLRAGDSFEFTFQFSVDRVQAFARVVGDDNPIHLDEAYARGSGFGHRIVHGMFLAGLVSRALGCDLPGPGTIYMGQELSFMAPVSVEDRVRVVLEVLELRPKGRVRIATRIFLADGTQVVDGEALVRAPRARVDTATPGRKDVRREHGGN